MKITVSKALEIRSALQNCDGHQVLVKENGEPKTTFVLFELGFNARFTIAKNLEALDKVNETYTKMRNDLIKSLAQNGFAINPSSEPEKFAEFMAKDQECLGEEIEVALIKLKKSDMEKCDLSVNVLSTIMPIIQE